MNEAREAQPISQRGVFWMLMPLGLLVVSVSGWLFMVAIAVDDPGFAVETDYYKKASNYDDVIAQEAENTRLGWTAEVVGFSWLPSGDARLTLAVTTGQKNPGEVLTVSAEAFPVARSTQMQSLRFEQKVPSVFTALVDRPRPGVWEVRVTLGSASGETVTATLRPELMKLAGATRGEAARE